MNKRKKIDLYFFLFSLFILSLLIFPIYNYGNKIEPLYFGIPFSLLWIIFCIIIQFLGIILFIFMDKKDI
jgi:hypothetical protein